MKKLFALLLALCLIVGLLPMAAMAEAPASVKVTIYPAKGAAARFYVTVNDGDTAYVAADTDKLAYLWTEANAPTTNYMKMEYAAESATLKVTFNNFVADMTDAGGSTCHGIEFASGEYAVAVELVGESTLTHGESACIKYHNAGGMTITGAGTLNLELNSGGCGALWANGGDLLIKDTTVNFNVNPGNDSKYHAILATKGSVTFEKAKIDSKTRGGCLVFLGKPQTKAEGDDINGRWTVDPNPDRKITIKDSEITVKAVNAVLYSGSPAVISNTTMTVTTESPNDKNYMFKPAPTLEGEYSAIAGLAKDAAKNPHKLKEYNPKKIASYSYFHMVPGKVDLIPTEPTEAETQAPTTEATQPTIADKNEATQPTTADKNEATKPTTSNKNEATQPTTADKNEATKPTVADKNEDNSSGKNEADPVDPLKIVLIVLIALIVAGGIAVGVILYLRNKNAEAYEEDEAEVEEDEAEVEEGEDTEAETDAEQE